ncbi:MAG: integrase [Fibrobacter sp.]|nr:integrase [Fibrobacter sp.]
MITEKRSNLSGIRKRGDKYQVNFQFERKRHWITIGSDKEEAIKFRKKLQYLSEEGTLREFLNESRKKNITYGDAVEEHNQKHLVHLKSADRAYLALKASLKFFSDRKITSIQWDEIEEFKNKRLKEVSCSTVRQELAMIGAVFERQLKNGVINDNVVKMVKPPLVNNVRENILSHLDFLKLLRAKWKYLNHGKEKVKNIEHYIKLALVIADYTAMRIGEILALTWDNVDLDSVEEPKIYIPVSKSKIKRHVPIHSNLKEILIKEKNGSNSRFVINKNKNRINRINKGFKNACLKAGLENTWIHDLRHRAITRWVQEGKSIPAIMAATGHATYSAFKRYTNLSDKDIHTLVGRKTKPLPLITFYDFYNDQMVTRKNRTAEDVLNEKFKEMGVEN